MSLAAKRARALAAAAASACLLLAGLPAGAGAAECPNESLRMGFSAQLPDCRAYELVTPDTIGSGIASLLGSEGGELGIFDTWLASPNGESVIFSASNGGILGLDGNGKYDQYQSDRTAAGWMTTITGPSGAQGGGFAGGTSSDHAYTFWESASAGLGTLAPPNSGERYSYLRHPDGAYEPIGVGSLALNREADGLLITPGGSHVIFRTSPRLGADTHIEPEAPPAPIAAIFDRPASGGPTRLISVLPSGATPQADARPVGILPRGNAVFFELNGVMYERLGGAETKRVATPAVGSRLSCSAAGATEFEWLRDGSPIVGSTSGYTATALDAGHVTQCRGTAIGQATTVSSPPTLIGAGGEPPMPAGAIQAPTPSEPQAGTTLTCDPGEWSGSPSFTYKWFKDGAPIAGASQQTYEVEAADVPSNLQCGVLATNSVGTVEADSASQPTSAGPAAAPGLRAEVEGSLAAVSSSKQSASIFAGASEDGEHSFFLASRESGEALSLFTHDFASGATEPIATAGKVAVINVSEDGSHVYFASTAVLSGAEQNENGEVAEAGKRNMYVWAGGETGFVARLAESDLATSEGGGFANPYINLGAWAYQFASDSLNFLIGRASDPSRTTPDGRFLVFQSHANLTPPFDSSGHSEVFRFDAASGEIECISCNRLGQAVTADAELQRIYSSTGSSPPLHAVSHISNVTPDGSLVVFETKEALLASDHNDEIDVYQWREGELSLISWGLGESANHLYGMSADGRDIFFQTFDTLVPQDLDGDGVSIYDARSGGGFPPPLKGAICEGEGCQGGVTPAPSLATAATPGFRGAGNVSEATHRKKQRHKKKHRRQGKRHAHKAKGGKR